MNDDKKDRNTQKSGSVKMLRAMVGIAILCSLFIVLTYESTSPRIEKLKSNALQEAIFKVLPGITKAKAFQPDESGGFVPITNTDKSVSAVFAGYDENDKLLGIAIKASGQGYADIIKILYGYDHKTQTIVGFCVLESKETPGLGDKIEKNPAFLLNFNSLDVSLDNGSVKLKNPVVTVKNGTKESAWEIDGITGATISSRAIGDIIGSSTEKVIPQVFENIELFKIQTEDE